MRAKVNDKEVTRFLDAWFEVRQFIQAANFNHFHKAGLSATQFMILNILPENGESISIGDLARRMNLKPATIARTVDTLEERKMLGRAKSTVDGRLVMVRITRAGKKLQNTAAGQFRERIAEVFRAVPESDRTALITGLESFVRASGQPSRRLLPGAEITPGAGGAPQEKRSSRRSRLP